MSQLSFQPALDPFHAIFRFLRILADLDTRLIRDHLRILDFYLLFPFRIRTIRLLPKHQRHKKLSEVYEHLRPYGEQPEAALLFKRMEPMQMAALETLASRSYINPSALHSGFVAKTEREAPAELAIRAAELNASQPDLMEFLRILAREYELTGENGLKARTGLLEYRYDSI